MPSALPVGVPVVVGWGGLWVNNSCFIPDSRSRTVVVGNGSFPTPLLASVVSRSNPVVSPVVYQLVSTVTANVTSKISTNVKGLIEGLGGVVKYAYICPWRLPVVL